MVTQFCASVIIGWKKPIKFRTIAGVNYATFSVYELDRSV